jgi:hypothetical protein
MQYGDPERTRGRKYHQPFSNTFDAQHGQKIPSRPGCPSDFRAALFSSPQFGAARATDPRSLFRQDVCLVEVLDWNGERG